MCETPKSPPGDYNYPLPSKPPTRHLFLCETPKSPPGDYNDGEPADLFAVGVLLRCETPKSPPGDYNLDGDGVRHRANGIPRVKHLNPRQGITTPCGGRNDCLVCAGV